MKNVRTRTQAFIDWLREAEEEDSEDDNEWVDGWDWSLGLDRGSGYRILLADYLVQTDSVYGAKVYNMNIPLELFMLYRSPPSRADREIDWSALVKLVSGAAQQ
jgi:hypothetical protein